MVLPPLARDYFRRVKARRRAARTPATPAGRARSPAGADIVTASTRLRKEREMAFYGEIDLVPGKSYDREQAVAAIEAADAVLAALRHLD